MISIGLYLKIAAMKYSFDVEEVENENETCFGHAPFEAYSAKEIWCSFFLGLFLVYEMVNESVNLFAKIPYRMSSSTLNSPIWKRKVKLVQAMSVM